MRKLLLLIAVLIGARVFFWYAANHQPENGDSFNHARELRETMHH